MSQHDRIDNFAIDRRVRLVCKLLWPAVNTQRTNFYLIDDCEISFKSCLMYVLKDSQGKTRLEYRVKEEHLHLHVQYLVKGRSAVALCAAYHPVLDIVVIYHEQIQDWYIWRGHGSRRS